MTEQEKNDAVFDEAVYGTALRRVMRLKARVEVLNDCVSFVTAEARKVGGKEGMRIANIANDMARNFTAGG